MPPPLTVVIVDDAPDFRQVVLTILTALPDLVAIVGEAADGEEAFTVALRERPDIVITDLMMPRLNGVELTRRIRQELPLTRIVLLSSYPEDAYRLMASDSRADAFVSKRVIHDALEPAIRDLIRRISGGSGPLPPSSVDRQLRRRHPSDGRCIRRGCEGPRRGAVARAAVG